MNDQPLEELKAQHDLIEGLKHQYAVIRSNGKLVDEYEDGWLAGARQEVWRVSDGKRWLVEFRAELNQRFDEPIEIRELFDHDKALQQMFQTAFEVEKQNNQIEADKKDPKKVLQCQYKNWKGEINVRNVVPLKMWLGISPFHQGEQWFMKVFDVDKQAERDFAVKDMLFR